MKTYILALPAMFAAVAAQASSFTPPPANNVPEIDALAGVAAVACVAATIALVRERRRRNRKD